MDLCLLAGLCRRRAKPVCTRALGTHCHQSQHSAPIVNLTRIPKGPTPPHPPHPPPPPCQHCMFLHKHSIHAILCFICSGYLKKNRENNLSMSLMWTFSFFWNKYWTLTYLHNNYLCTYDLDSPVHNVLDAPKNPPTCQSNGYAHIQNIMHMAE